MVKFPLNVLTVVTGVSGSGKSSSKKHPLPCPEKVKGGFADKTGVFDKLRVRLTR